MDDIQQQVNEEEIATFYNKVEEIWPSNEPWYKYTYHKYNPHSMAL